MTANTGYSTSQTEIGIAIETTRGTPVAPAFWFKPKTPKYKPNLTWNEDKTLQGSMVDVYDLVSGLRYDEHGWDSMPYLDSFPVLLRGELGSSDTVVAKPSNTTLAALAAAGASSISTTATIASGSWIVIGTGGVQETHLTSGVTGSGPYTVALATPLINGQANGATVVGLTKHTIGLLNNGGAGNQSPTMTITDYAGDAWRQVAAATMDSLDIKGSATGILSYTCDFMGNPAITPSTPTPSFTNAQAVPGWTSQISIAGSQVQYYVDWEISLKRGTKPVPALTGSQSYFLYFQSALQATAKMTVLLQNGSPELAAYEAGTVQALDITTYDMRSGYAMNLHCTNAQFKATGGLDRSKEIVEVPLDVQLLPSSTDAVAGGVSPIVCTVANAQTTAY